MDGKNGHCFSERLAARRGPRLSRHRASRMGRVIRGCILLFLSTPVLAQSSPSNLLPGQAVTPQTGVNIPSTEQLAPQTKLEQIIELRGATLIKGHGDIGTVSADKAEVSVVALRLIEAHGEETEGLQVMVSDLTGASSTRIAFVDYDEIDGLLRAIDDISSVNSGVTRLEDYEASYSTKGDLEISVHSTSQGKEARVQADSISPLKVRISLNQLTTLKALIDDARTILDNTRQRPVPAPAAGQNDIAPRTSLPR
jgi:hypothetical protein